MKAIEFKIPTQAGTDTRRGYKVALLVGKARKAFVLQLGEDGAPDTLAHYASGYSMGSLNPIMIRQMTRGAGRADPRAAAQVLLSDLVSKHGADKVNSRIEAAPVLNR